MSGFVHLRVASGYSFQYGASHPAELVAEAAAHGMDALAITDRGGLYGAVRFMTAAREAGVHPVIGIEIELVDAAAPDPDGIVLPAARRATRVRRGSRAAAGSGLRVAASSATKALSKIISPRITSTTSMKGARPGA